MKRTEATRTANRRWTNRAMKRYGYVRETDAQDRIREVEGGGVFQVGYTTPPHGPNDGGHFNVQGEGDSWEAAFADADRRDTEFQRQVEERRQASLTRGRAAVADVRTELKRSGSKLKLVGYARSMLTVAASVDAEEVWSPHIDLPDDKYLRSDFYRGDNPEAGRPGLWVRDAYRDLVERCAKAHKVRVRWNNGNDFWFSEE